MFQNIRNIIIYKSIKLASLYFKFNLFFNYSLLINPLSVNCSRLLKLKYTKPNEFIILKEINGKFKFKLEIIKDNKPNSDYLIHIENRMLYYKIQGERIDIIQKTNSEKAEGGKINTTKKRVMFLNRYNEPASHHFYSKPKQIKSLDTTGVSKLLQGFETTSPFIKTDDFEIPQKNKTKDTQNKAVLNKNKEINNEKINPQVEANRDSFKTHKPPDHVDSDIQRYKMPIKKTFKTERNFVDETAYKESNNHSHESNYAFIDLASDTETPEFIIKGVFINPIASNTFQLSNMSHSDRNSKYKNDTTRIPVCLTFIPTGNKKHKSKKSEELFIFSPCTKSKNQLFEVKMIDDLFEEDVVSESSSSSNRVVEKSMSSSLKKVNHKHKRNKSVRKVKVNENKNRKKSKQGITDSKMELMKRMKLFNDSSSKSDESTSSMISERETDKSKEKQNVRNQWMGSVSVNKPETQKSKELKEEPKIKAKKDPDPFEALISQLNSSFNNNSFKNFKV